uniref:Uncharacterized protein n=1 Tax=Anopheles arabiensis TaxID=7173 RepID=A0A182IGA3_ANOAR
FFPTSLGPRSFHRAVEVYFYCEEKRTRVNLARIAIRRCAKSRWQFVKCLCVRKSFSD